MSLQICASAVPNSAKNASIQNARRSVTYHPSVWGDRFLAYTSDVTDISVDEEKEHQKLKEEVKKLFTTTPNDSLHKLNLIDSIQRLGVGYHFETEVENSLKYVHDGYDTKSFDEQDSKLHTTALRFRLLRQQGYRISCGVFNKFKDQQGKFDESLNDDVQGLLALYEAAQYRVHGEEILEEALKFSMTQLNSLVGRVNNSLATQIREALDMPIHKTLTRLGARHFISTYQQDESHSEILLNFAKLDFNLLQKIHQKELHDLTRWWRALAFREKLPFARDRMVESYFWALAVYFEPRYAFGRKILTKVLSMATILDDIYDVYGTLDELQLFTDAIERWNVDATDQLPQYMKHAYEPLLEIYVEAEEELKKIGPSDRVYYVIQEMKKMIWSYFEEAKWTYGGYFPTMDEYMKVALTSCGYEMVTATSLLGMGGEATKEAFDCITSEPVFMRASLIICRLMDDMAGHGFEQKIGAIECYMNHKGASKEETLAAFQTQVTNAWKDINKECLRPTTVPTAVLMGVVNLSRVINLYYKDGDGFKVSKSKLKRCIDVVLVEQLKM